MDVPALGVRRRWSVLAVCALALFLVGLDTTIITTGLTQIGRGLAVDAAALSWVADAYTVVFASLLITAGALADRIGRRRVFRIGLLVFGASSLLCAVAGSLPMLIAARAFQGVGASMLSPVALAIVVNVMRDPRERAQAIGVWGAMFGLSMAAGPLTGGVLLTVFDWRALFWINVPVILVVLALVALVVPESRGQKIRRIDLPGQLLLIAILGIAVGLLIEGPRHGWQEVWVLPAIAGLVVLLWVFARVEQRRSEPLIDPGLFRVPSFTGAILGAVAVFVAFSMTLLLTTRIVQGSWEWTAIDAGVLILPMALGATVLAPVSGFLVGRYGPRPPLLGAGALLALGGACLLIAVETGQALVLMVAYLLVGSGIGLANAPITNTAVSGLPPDRAGVAGGTASSARQVGTAIGIALAGTLLADASPGQYAGASLPGWIIVAACGLLLITVGVLAARSTHPQRGG
ncbi:MFS transporter [Brevibacterium aurantiacum]|uniref:MFS transporter n=1 Tax=Brevibacterium aurantiacum TaxID=273384 RepID=A0A556CAP8_BREAU|nr:MFS transporter [Brevibacterium aurantiacum]TSI14503.1 MFS transporter [Brevibacterium aurantiacum]